MRETSHTPISTYVNLYYWLLLTVGFVGALFVAVVANDPNRYLTSMRRIVALGLVYSTSGAISLLWVGWTFLLIRNPSQ